MRRDRKRRLQSAMEYLMTYGWAILIIAVVLGALFQLGVFNSGTFAPRAPPGACQVFRPNGPDSVQLINLEGVCNGELPQYVAATNPITAGYVALPASAAQQLLPPSITVTAWVYPSSPQPMPGEGFTVVTTYCRPGNSGFDGYELRYYGDGEYDVQLGGATSTLQVLVPVGIATVLFGKWQLLAVTYSGSTGSATAYVNSAAYTTSNSAMGNLYYGTSPSSLSPAIAGGDSCGGHDTVNGTVANVQMYNASLSSAEINAIYLEGIGGAPIKLQNLVGWWPLNGNANDYSGNNNNGVPSGVTYT
ncbi:MAG: LamG domain-containing protein, partial [Candidatus Marsarchaeota archaeon]|nr:LamG domain-containing protein [Candidatus Marsarchaeota archaeon]